MSDVRGACDSCGRQGLLRFSGEHCAWFCPTCYERENGAKS